MVTDFQLAVRGQLGAMMRDEIVGVRFAAFKAVSGAAKKTKDGIAQRLRRQFSGAKRISGAPIANTTKAKATRKANVPFSPRARVYSVARYRRGSQVFDLIDAFDRGGVIRAGSGKWLAIPTADAPLSASGKRKARPREVTIPLQFVPSRKSKNTAVLVGNTFGGKTKVMFVLKRQIRLRRRLNIDRIRNAKSRSPVTILNRELVKLDRKLERKYRRA